MNLRVSVYKEFSGFSLTAGFVANSQRVGIFGRSGSGKSTLVHMIAGLVEPDSGTIELGGEVLFSSKDRINLPPEKRRIAVVFQQAHLFPHMNAKRNLFYGYRRTPAPLRTIDPDELIEVLDLKKLLGRNVETLSGGERQRVALGRAVLANPRLLVMDEPLSALDEGLKYQIIPYLTAVFERFQIPVLLISHSMNEMRLMTDEVVVLHRGKVSDQTSPEGLARERMGWTRAGYINLLDLKNPRPQDGLLAFDWGEMPLLLSPGRNEQGGMFELSSKDIMLFKRHPEAISARNLLKCQVCGKFDLEGRVGVELHSQGQRLIAQVVNKAAEELEIRCGREVYAVIKASAFRRLY